MVGDNSEHVVESVVDLVTEEGINDDDRQNEHSPLLPSSSVDENGGDENNKKNTPLHLAAMEGDVEKCMKIGGTKPSLIAKRNKAGETPLFLAASHGNREAFLWLHHLYIKSFGASSVNDHFAHCCTRDNDDTILHCAITREHFVIFEKIPAGYKAKNKATTLEELEKKNILDIKFKRMRILWWLRFLQLMIVLYALQQDLLFFVFIQPALLEMYILLEILTLLLASLFSVVVGTWIDNMLKLRVTHIWSLQIMNKLLKEASDDEDMSHIISRTPSQHLSLSLPTPNDGNNNNEWKPTMAAATGRITIETPLMIAAKNGITEMVEEILKFFPSRIEDLNLERKNILLLAVEYRQRMVFDFLCKRTTRLSESLIEQVDEEGNNVLHLAARTGVKSDRLNLREVYWFENSAPHELLGKYNRKMESPEDMFKKNHEELIKRELEWAAKTLESCSVVSTLVASVAFATRSSVPGGYDENGFAILRNNGQFWIFEACELEALVFCLISTICFLSILASSPFENSVQSWRSVSFKLYFSMLSMFASILCLWFSFCSGHFFILSDFWLQMDFVLFYMFPSLPIILLVLTQLSTFFAPLFYSIHRIPAPGHNATPPIEYRLKP